MLHDRTVLEDYMGFAGIPRLEPVLIVNRPSVYAFIYAKQCCSDITFIPFCKRPETAMRITILRADPGMQNIGSMERDGEDILPEEVFAAGDDDIRPSLGEEVANLRPVRIFDFEQRCFSGVPGVFV